MVLLSSFELSAQVKINSPYSRFGLGWLVENRFETRIMGMGGMSIGLQDGSLLNPANPASYAAFDSTSFIFQGGLFGTTLKLQTLEQSETANYMSMSHLLFGFQIKKWWKTSFGVLPFSHVGYDVFSENMVEDVGKVRFNYQGSGGFNKFYWGNAFVPFKGFSIGFNASYLFGTIYHTQGVNFPDSIQVKTTRAEFSMTANDFFFDLGLQYKLKLKNKLFLTTGVVYSNQTEMDASTNYLLKSYYGDFNDVTIFTDTIEYLTDQKGSFILPKEFGFGVSLQKQEKWLIGADFKWENWATFKMFDRQDSLRNSWRIAVGGEIIPDKYSLTSYFQKISYRFGVRYGMTYLNLRDTDIDEIGISFGFGFPMRRSLTTLNLAVEVGKKGTTGNDLIRENYIRFTFSVNIFEHWFQKRKYY